MTYLTRTLLVLKIHPVDHRCSSAPDTCVRGLEESQQVIWTRCKVWWEDVLVLLNLTFLCLACLHLTATLSGTCCEKHGVGVSCHTSSWLLSFSLIWSESWFVRKSDNLWCYLAKTCIYFFKRNNHINECFSL